MPDDDRSIHTRGPAMDDGSRTPTLTDRVERLAGLAARAWAAVAERERALSVDPDASPDPAEPPGPHAQARALL
ncbi:MAG: hypothetical protein R3C32_12670 [Chloroflexota bacterium]